MKKLLLIVLLSGCATFGGGPGTLSESIDYGYLAVQSVRLAVQTECGNVVADGPCSPTSLISTQDKALVKTQLLTTVDLLDSANLMLNNGDVDGSAGSLAMANGVLKSIRQVLQNRGLEE